MILPLSAIWGGEIDYRAGNAQRFDGVFDYDTINLPDTGFFTAAGEWSILIELEITTGSKVQIILDYGIQGGNAAEKGVSILIDSSNKMRIQWRDTNGNRTVVTADTAFSIGAPQNLIITKVTGVSGASFEFYINGVLSSKTISENSATTGATKTIAARIGARYNDTLYFDGKIKQLERIDRVATAGEITDADSAGSFRGAGIAHNSGDYELAIDFDKVTGQDPTTYTDTPVYNVTGVGGTTFETYL